MGEFKSLQRHNSGDFEKRAHDILDFALKLNSTLTTNSLSGIIENRKILLEFYQNLQRITSDTSFALISPEIQKELKTIEVTKKVFEVYLVDFDTTCMKFDLWHENHTTDPSQLPLFRDFLYKYIGIGPTVNGLFMWP